MHRARRGARLACDGQGSSCSTLPAVPWGAWGLFGTSATYVTRATQLYSKGLLTNTGPGSMDEAWRRTQKRVHPAYGG